MEYKTMSERRREKKERDRLKSYDFINRQLSGCGKVPLPNMTDEERSFLVDTYNQLRDEEEREEVK